MRELRLAIGPLLSYQGGMEMKTTFARIWLVVAALLFLASGQWLAASCAVDEATSTVYRAAPLDDWCKEYKQANCIWLRANFSSGNINCESGNTKQWDAWGCVCPCSVQALKWCNSGYKTQGGTESTVTLWYCLPASTSCP